MTLEADAGSTLTLYGDRLLEVLRAPVQYFFKPGIWYAINCEQDLVTDRPEATLAGRLDLSAESLKTELALIGLGSADVRSWKRVLQTAEVYITKAGIGTKNIAFIAFGKEPLFAPKDQIKPLSLLPQPAVLSKSTMAIAGLKRPRDPSPQFRSSVGRPAAATTAGPSSPAAAASPSRPPQRLSSKTLGEILAALGCSTPFRDPAGAVVRPALAKKRFGTAFNEMAKGSGTKAELLAAASVAVHAVLSMLAPDPLGTAAALAVPRRRSKEAEPLRLALVTAAQPTGSVLDQLIAASPLAQSLLSSYVAAANRKEKMAVKAQILAPLTAQYSLRTFNECFEVQLAGAG
eukprot:573816-Prymnesium_polylepis.1